MTDLPHEIQVWRSTDTLDHIGTWATTRFPAEAVTYVPKADAQAAVALVVERAAEAAYEADSLEISLHGANGIAERIRAFAQASGVALVQSLRAERDGLRRNLRETFEAMCAMRDAINEHVPMPSLESDLLQGPENSVFCAAVAEAVIADRDRLAAANAALKAQVARLVGLLKKSRPSVANMAHGWPEDDALVKEIDAALAEVQARDDASTPPDTTWHERRTMLPDGDARAVKARGE